MADHNGKIKVIVALIGTITMLLGLVIGSAATYHSVAIPRNEVMAIKMGDDAIHANHDGRITSLERTVPPALARIEAKVDALIDRLNREGR